MKIIKNAGKERVNKHYLYTSFGPPLTCSCTQLYIYKYLYSI